VLIHRLGELLGWSRWVPRISADEARPERQPLRGDPWPGCATAVPADTETARRFARFSAADAAVGLARDFLTASLG
jgi:hypothetical protein